MPIRRPWRVAAGVGAATVVLAGLGAAAYAGNAFDLKDQGVPSNVEMTQMSDDSAGDSGNDSSDSPFDGPADTGSSANSGSTADSAASGGTADSSGTSDSSD